jgi:copper chaperone
MEWHIKWIIGGLTMNKKIWLNGMHCGHCVGRVEKALKELETIGEVLVDLSSQSATVEILEALDEAILVSVLDEAGYEVLRMEDLE